MTAPDLAATVRARERAEALLRLRDSGAGGEYPSDLPYVMAAEYLAITDELQNAVDALRQCVSYIEADCEGTGHDGVPRSAREVLAEVKP